jgi:hypothetical protein
MINNQEINRRDFIRGGAMTMFCLSFGLKEALANAKLTGKPVLTEESINALLAREAEAKNLKSVITKFSSSPLTWITNNFSITELQKKAIRSISAADWDALRNALKPVAEKGGTIRVQLLLREESPGLLVSASNKTSLGRCRGSAGTTTTTPDGTTTTTVATFNAEI